MHTVSWFLPDMIKVGSTGSMLEEPNLKFWGTIRNIWNVELRWSNIEAIIVRTEANYGGMSPDFITDCIFCIFYFFSHAIILVNSHLWCDPHFSNIGRGKCKKHKLNLVQTFMVWNANTITPMFPNPKLWGTIWNIWNVELGRSKVEDIIVRNDAINWTPSWFLQNKRVWLSGLRL